MKGNGNIVFMVSSASGLSGSKETAQTQVSVGMGLLAGSTVMLLTLLWGSCLIVGKCDIENSKAIDQKDTRAFSLTGIYSYYHLFDLTLFNTFYYVWLLNLIDFVPW